MPALSVVIITHNEERNIARCLESVKEIADDIVVVDSLSTDGTQAICESYGARFFATAWKGYSAMKNYANSLARHDWIFSIDADEALSDDLRRSILEIKPSGELRSYRIGRITNYCGHWIHHSGWYPDVKVRFFDRRTTSWEGLIHERLNVARDEDAPLLKGHCYHYSYYTIEEHKAQADRFSALSAESLYKRGKKAGWVKLYLAPVFRFLKMYFFQAGFLDGRSGFIIARISAAAVHHKYIKLQQLHAHATN